MYIVKYGIVVKTWVASYWGSVTHMHTHIRSTCLYMQYTCRERVTSTSAANDVAVSLRVRQIFKIHTLCSSCIIVRRVFNETEIRTSENNAYADDVKIEKDLCDRIGILQRACTCAGYAFNACNLKIICEIPSITIPIDHVMRYIKANEAMFIKYRLFDGPHWPRGGKI